MLLQSSSRSGVMEINSKSSHFASQMPGPVASNRFAQNSHKRAQPDGASLKQQANRKTARRILDLSQVSSKPNATSPSFVIAPTVAEADLTHQVSSFGTTLATFHSSAVSTSGIQLARQSFFVVFTGYRRIKTQLSQRRKSCVAAEH